MKMIMSLRILTEIKKIDKMKSIINTYIRLYLIILIAFMSLQALTEVLVNNYKEHCSNGKELNAITISDYHHYIPGSKNILSIQFDDTVCTCCDDYDRWNYVILKINDNTYVLLSELRNELYFGMNFYSLEGRSKQLKYNINSIERRMDDAWINNTCAGLINRVQGKQLQNNMLIKLGYVEELQRKTIIIEHSQESDKNNMITGYPKVSSFIYNAIMEKKSCTVKSYLSYLEHLYGIDEIEKFVKTHTNNDSYEYSHDKLGLMEFFIMVWIRNKMKYVKCRTLNFVTDVGFPEPHPEVKKFIENKENKTLREMLIALDLSDTINTDKGQLLGSFLINNLPYKKRDKVYIPEKGFSVIQYEGHELGLVEYLIKVWIRSYSDYES